MNKKIYVIIALAVICMIGGVVAISATAKERNPNRIYDVNRDGVINFQDAGFCFVYVRDHVNNKYGNLLYDVNCDGKVDTTDYNLIWQNRD